MRRMKKLLILNRLINIIFYFLNFFKNFEILKCKIYLNIVEIDENLKNFDKSQFYFFTNLLK